MLNVVNMFPMRYIFHGLAVYFLLFLCVKWAIHLTAIFYGKWKLHRKTVPPSSEVPWPGVSIIKPLMWVDPNLYSNLETFFTQDYPKFEILLCVEEESDPATMVARRLMSKYPSVECRLFTRAAAVGVNPKINNMQPGYAASRYELVLISDSSVRMKADTLRDMASRMTGQVGLVHQLPFTCDGAGFAAALQKIYFGTVQARIYLASDFLGIACHIGMSSLVRKELLEEAGGLAAFGRYLAEDFFLGRWVVGRGWRTCVSGQPAWQNPGACEVSGFLARLTRWAKLRAAMVPVTILVEPLSECAVLGVCASWGAARLLGADPCGFYLVHALVWLLLDWALLSVVQNGALPFGKLEFVTAWLFRELSSPCVYVRALCSPTVTWRARSFRLRWGGEAEQLVSRV
ncbi:ceramide glucosyltransferase-like [Bacillus rossius redtenbacheri]|uniref:ceramide glucosyltransferase-like n=1 Tax=Bacillus rossius redtenbacheri TaxID=93214 RepID=UPI002FDDBB69